MQLGLEHGRAALCPHQEGWAALAQEAVRGLWGIFSGYALDIQHIGSTAIPGILAKPILDIAVGVGDLEHLDAPLAALEATGRYKKRVNRFSSHLLYLLYDESGRRTHQIHILPMEDEQWLNYVNFRDYLIRFPEKAREYEALKVRLARDYGDSQMDYTDGKKEYMERMLREARAFFA